MSVEPILGSDTTLFSVILLLLVGGALSWLSEGLNKNAPRVIAIVTQLLALVIIVGWYPTGVALEDFSEAQQWWAYYQQPWIPRFGIQLLFAVDGLSWLLLMLTIVLGIISVVISWTEITRRSGFFHFNLLWTIAGIFGVFTALDMFLFFVFWEVMLIPMYFLIAIWGHGNRGYAALKFFLFTQISGLLMLISIIALAVLAKQQTGEFSFNYFEWLELNLSTAIAFWVSLGFFIAFLVKLPALPFHTWLPDAHTEAPTAGSVILAAILLKTGAYGLIRFVLPLFPNVMELLKPAAMMIGAVGVVYGAVLAFAQSDLKRLVAYTSVSHMGFVLLGVFALNERAMQGAVMQMLAHGFSTAALFILVGGLQERLHTRDMANMGGFWQLAPKLGVATLFFAVASLGLPGLGNFVAEFLVLLGSFPTDPLATIIAAIGLILAAVYSLTMAQRVIFGPVDPNKSLPDLYPRERWVMFFMAVALIWLGLFPQPVFHLSQNAVDLALTQVLAVSVDVAEFRL